MLRAASSNSGNLKLHRALVLGEVSNEADEPNSPDTSASSLCGTPFAVNYLRLGVAGHLPRSSRRGGAHNRADRESHFLRAAQVANLIAAAAHSQLVGLPFTRMITIHWEAAGVPLEGMARATGRFLDLMTKALTRHDSRTAWLWVHENGERKGGHCHLLAHVPASLVAVLTRLQKRWLKSITNSPYRAGVILSKPIGGRLGLEKGSPEVHAVNLQSALGYVLKGANEEGAVSFDLQRLEPGGRIIGKRCGTSQNIGVAARKRGQ